jgi:hypothetical protein
MAMESLQTLSRNTVDMLKNGWILVARSPPGSSCPVREAETRRLPSGMTSMVHWKARGRETGPGWILLLGVFQSSECVNVHAPINDRHTGKSLFVELLEL